MKTKNIDSLLANVDLTPDSLQGRPEPIEVKPEHLSSEDLPLSSSASEADAKEIPSESVADGEKITSPTEVKASQEESPSIDDYGQLIPKTAKTYTQEEVEKMMRDRNSRGEFAKQEINKAIQEALAQHGIDLTKITPQVQQDEDDLDWQSELKSLVKETFAEMTKEQQRQQMEQIQRQQQIEFEIKFNTSAAKYPDFEQVVVGKPLTPEMVIATRGMADPAAFLYAAAKTQPQELERISKIQDRFVQAVELGKLEERMRRSKVSHSSAPKPIDMVKGDMGDKDVRRRSVDDILREEESKRIRERRR